MVVGMIPFWVTLLLSASSIIGGVVNARGRIEGFYIWIATSIAWGGISIIEPTMLGQLPMWTAYLVISSYGVLIWKKRPHFKPV